MKHSSNYFKYCSPFCMFTCWNCPQRNNVNTPEFYWNECCTITSLECLFTRSDIKVKRLVPKKKKKFYFIYSSTTMWSPSKYIHCACRHLYQQCYQCLSHSLNTFCGMSFKTCITDLWMPSVDSNWCAFTVDLTF